MLMMEERAGLLCVGDTAPNFDSTLPDGTTIALSDYAGRKNVVLSFYPKDFTPGCTRQLCSYRDNYEHVLAGNAVLLGISYDSAGSHRRFSEQHDLPFQLVSDTTGEIARSYGVARFGGRLLPLKRVTYVIDTGGIVRGVFHHEVNVEQHIEDILNALRVPG
jgi:peroxiredoxin Q/BCP